MPKESVPKNPAFDASPRSKTASLWALPERLEGLGLSRDTEAMHILKEADKIKNPVARFLYIMRTLHAVGDKRGKVLSDVELTILDKLMHKQELTTPEAVVAEAIRKEIEK